MQRELYTRLVGGISQAGAAPAVVTADVNQATNDSVGMIDLKGYNSVLIEYNFGAEGAQTLDATSHIAETLMESDATNSGYAAVATTDLVGSLVDHDAAGDQPAVNVVAYIGTKRYIKPGLNVTGTLTTGVPAAITVYRGHARAL